MDIRYNGKQTGLPAAPGFEGIPDLDLYTVYPAGTTFAVPVGSDRATVEAAAAETLKNWN